MSFSIKVSEYLDVYVFGNCHTYYRMVDFLEERNLPLPVEYDHGGTMDYVIEKDFLLEWQIVVENNTTKLQRFWWKLLSITIPVKCRHIKTIVDLLEIKYQY